MSNKKFGAKEVLDVTLYDMATNRPVMYFDTLKTSSIAFTSEKVYARGGKGNPKLIVWEINKEGTLTITDALLSTKSLEVLSGIAGQIGARTIHMRQATQYDITGTEPVDMGGDFPLKADNGGLVQLAYAPLEDAANIIVYDADDEFGTPLAVSAVDADAKTITVDGAADKSVIVYYTFTSSADTESYSISADKFSSTYKMVGKTVIRNAKTQQDEAFEVEIIADAAAGVGHVQMTDELYAAVRQQLGEIAGSTRIDLSLIVQDVRAAKRSDSARRGEKQE